MKSLDDLKLDQKQVRTKIKEFATLEDFTDEDQAQLTALKSQALKLDLQITAREEAIKAEAEEEEDRKAELSRAVEDAIKKTEARKDAENRRLPYSEAPYAAKHGDEWKYDNLDGAELSVAIEVGKGLGVKFEGAAMKAMSRRMGDIITELSTSGKKEDRKTADYLRSSFKMQTKTGIEPTKEAIESAIKAATDPMYTGGSGIGSDWVGTAYSTDIWRVIRAENRVAGMVPSDIIPDGYASKTWPLEGLDMTWYKVPEASTSDSTLKVPAATVTASQVATGSKNIPVAKIGARGIYTGELTEDSLIA